MSNMGGLRHKWKEPCDPAASLQGRRRQAAALLAETRSSYTRTLPPTGIDTSNNSTPIQHLNRLSRAPPRTGQDSLGPGGRILHFPGRENGRRSRVLESLDNQRRNTMIPQDWYRTGLQHHDTLMMLSRVYEYSSVS